MKIGIIKLLLLGIFFVFFIIGATSRTVALSGFDLLLLTILLFLFSESFLLWLGLITLIICPFLLILSQELAFIESLGNFSFLIFAIVTTKFISRKENEKK
jgi:hypothetical protein